MGTGRVMIINSSTENGARRRVQRIVVIDINFVIAVRSLNVLK